jgi:hypothetical protein
VNYDRRTLVVSALALIVVIVGGMAIVAITSDASARNETKTQAAAEARGADAAPSIIPQPGEGQEPKSANERGGSEQLALFGLVLAAMAGIGVVVFRGGKTARAGRAEWLAAGRTGHDGVMLGHDELDPDADLTPAPAEADLR